MPAPVHRGPFVFCPKSGKLIGCRSASVWVKWPASAVGLLALLWYLIRVLPKPSRADYPCQRVAGPLAFGFIGYLTSFIVTIFAFRKARRCLWQARYGLAAGFAIVAATAGLVSLRTATNDAQARAAWTPTDPPNTPIGVARGINPGRVVWVRDANATHWDGKNGHWWDLNATDQARVDAMMSQSLRALTSADDDAAAWVALFRSYNHSHGKGESGYAAGQKIVIKINQNTARGGHALNGNPGNQNSINGNPQLILSMLRQLVNRAGVAPSDIFIYDISRYIADNIFVPCRAEFPQVHFVELDKGGGEGREAAPPENQWVQNAITYKDPLRGLGRSLPPFIVDASYMINMAIMKNHGDAGPTLLAKNHFGTVHGLNHGAISPKRMGESNPLVDLMAHKDVGEKTVLFMIDALYAADGPDASPSKWKMAPFNHNWPASIFISQDGVAIESVGFDFVNTEWGCDPFTDNLLHEAALANHPPSGKPYGPVSLGVHEHWNNPAAMQYSRNLGAANGIELMPVVFPPPPTGLAISPGNNRIDLGWPNSPGVTNFSVKRATQPGGPYKLIAEITETHFADTDVINGAAYYYVVSSENALGKSADSVEISAKPGPSIRAVNCGGPAAGHFAADTGFIGGGSSSGGAGIEVAGLSDPAPTAVYQSERHGDCTYTFNGLIPGENCTVRLHFAETYWSEAGKRVFNVGINGKPVLNNFDIIAQTGARNKAMIREFAAKADDIGQIVINFASVKDGAKCSGIEIVATSQ